MDVENLLATLDFELNECERLNSRTRYNKTKLINYEHAIGYYHAVAAALEIIDFSKFIEITEIYNPRIEKLMNAVEAINQL